MSLVGCFLPLDTQMSQNQRECHVRSLGTLQDCVAAVGHPVGSSWTWPGTPALLCCGGRPADITNT